VSLFVANLFVSRLLLALIKDIPITLPIYVLFYFIMGYLGFVLGKEKSKTIDLSKVPLFDRLEEDKDIKLLDTSTIIDGRIADICETGFIQGTFVIPQFVLYEIQHIADHQDPVKRTRGRRGLDVLHRLQKQTFLAVRIVDYDFPKLKDVDTKLIALAKRLGGKIVTNDYNLNKVAEFHGIEVLNMNQLAMSLRPALLPGEQMSIKVLREGKEQGQGIGYLDDGTMVVVDDARKHLGKTVELCHERLQTTRTHDLFEAPRERRVRITCTPTISVGRTGVIQRLERPIILAGGAGKRMVVATTRVPASREQTIIVHTLRYLNSPGRGRHLICRQTEGSSSHSGGDTGDYKFTRS
jgi:uncharacterized protein YacL